MAVLALAACVSTAPTAPDGRPAAPGYFPAAAAPSSVLAEGGAQLSLRNTAASEPRAVPQFAPASYPGGRPRTAESSAAGAELAYVRDILTDLQLRSFRENREFCGYIGFDPGGKLTTTQINGGDEASCPLPFIPPSMTVLASFHTHSTYSPYYASEFPTSQDMETDASDDIDGYISTPGGRLWHVDSDTMTVRQLCGRGCLPQDPNYRPEDDGPLRPVFTYQDLVRLESF